MIDLKKLIFLFILLAINCTVIYSKEHFPTDELKDIEVIDLKPVEYVSLDLIIEKQLNDSRTWSTVNHQNPKNLDYLKIDVFTSSILENKYSGLNLFDDNVNTAWVEGAKGDGIGEWIRIEINGHRESHTTQPFSIWTVGVIPGYAKNQKIWEANNRVKKALLVIYSPDSFGGKNTWSAFRLHFIDKNAMQLFDIPVEYIGRNMPMKKTVWFMIEEIYKGNKYDDTCISELFFKGGYSN